MNDSDCIIKYESKNRIKLWESNFMEKFGRKPNKNDIKVADTTIREAYKIYWKLKTETLNETLTNITFCEDSKKNTLSVSKPILQKIDPVHIDKEKATDCISEKREDNCLAQHSKILKISSHDFKDKININDVWDINLKESQNFVDKSQNIFDSNLSLFKLSQNMFKSSNFSKRNPRKTFCKVYDDTNTKLSIVPVSQSYKLKDKNNEYSFSKDHIHIQTNNCAKLNNTFQLLIEKCPSVSNKEQLNQNHSLNNDSFSDNEDYVCNSESDLESKKKRICNTKKIIHDVDLNPSKRICISNEVNLDEKPIYNHDSQNVTTMPQTVASDNFSKQSIVEIKSTEISEINIHSFKRQKFKRTSLIKNYNENYMKLNLKKKIFVRGKKSFNFSKYKKYQWGKKKEEANSSSKKSLKNLINENNEFLCLNCKTTGHLAKQCISFKENSLLSLDTRKDVSNHLRLQMLEEVTKLDALNMDSKTICDKNIRSKNNLNTVISQTEEVHPVYELKENGTIIDTPLEVLVALKKFGHNEFREGQEKVIMRILSGLSTLVILATGFGKSLCYQLPAYIYAKKSNCITLIISPLVSLMNDQVTGIPNFLPAACLYANQSPKLRSKVLKMLKEKKVAILFVSPETIAAKDESNIYDSIFCNLPIAFACIDEVHCISQWSHNFRPSYLMVCKILNEKFGVKRFLGLTATASQSTRINLINFLSLNDGIAGVITGSFLPSNLQLTISRDERKEEALIKLLCSKILVNCNSIIIYCTRREECDRVASMLRVSLRKSASNYIDSRQNNISAIAESYHAGLSVHKRKIIQTAFMNSYIRVIVATVAFGMGINKPDIRSVIHFNMPACFESYVQEIGRAGRDGFSAYCHMFLSYKDNYDEYELKRHINANRVDRHVIRRLLQKVFKTCSCADQIKSDEKTRCKGHEIAFSIEETVKELDTFEETLTTILCYLELDSKHFIRVLPSSFINVKVISYGRPYSLRLAAQHSPSLAAGISISMKHGTYNINDYIIEFSIIDTAAAIGCNVDKVKYELKKLEMINVKDKLERSDISVKFHTLGFRVVAPGDLTDKELDEILESLYNKCQLHAMMRFHQLKLISTESRKFSFDSVKQCLESTQKAKLRSEQFKSSINSYFEQDHSSLNVMIPASKISLENKDHIIADIRGLIGTYRDNYFTSRSIARIFHGIQSPNYPAYIWSRCPYWRAHITDDFEIINQLATEEILKLQ